jgi:hypothetical protein
MPLTPMRRSNSCRFEIGEKSEELQRVLAHVGVDAERHLARRLRDAVVGGERHVHVVADPLHVHGEPVGMFLEHAPAEERNHPLAGGRYCRQLRGSFVRGAAARATSSSRAFSPP